MTGVTTEQIHHTCVIPILVFDEIVVLFRTKYSSTVFSGEVLKVSPLDGNIYAVFNDCGIADNFEKDFGKCPRRSFGQFDNAFDLENSSECLEH